MRIFKSILIFIIQGLRPMLGPVECKYPFTCGKFALWQLETQPVHKALWEIIKRILACNPLW